MSSVYKIGSNVLLIGGSGVLTMTTDEGGSEFTPNVGTPSTAFDINWGGGSDVFARAYTGFPGGATGLKRANMWGYGQSGYSTDWNVYFNGGREYRMRGDFANGGGSPKGYPGIVRGWTAGESATNAEMGLMGIRLNALTKWKTGRQFDFDAAIPATTSARAVALDDLYLASVPNPDTTRDDITHNILLHWYISDDQSIAYWANNFNGGYTITTSLGNQFRVYHDSTPAFSNRCDIYVAVMDGWTASPFTEEWGRLSGTIDVKDLLEAMRDSTELDEFFTDYNDLYVVSHQTFVEPVALTSAQYLHVYESWIALQNEPDGGESVPLGVGGKGLISTSIDCTGFNGSTADANGGEACTNDRNLYWRSSGIPCTINYQLGTVRPEYKARLLHLFQCTTSYSIDPTLISQPGYNNVGGAVLESHTTDYGPKPTSGWTNRATITAGNTRTLKAHLIEPTSGSDLGMLAFRVTDSHGSSGNADFAGVTQLFCVPGTGRPDIAFMGLGDSQMANGLNLYDSDRTTKTMALQVYDLCGQSIAWAPHGWPGQSAAGFATTALTTLEAWLDDWPGKYCVILLGSNDGSNTTDFTNNMIAIGNECTSRGITPIFCTPPYSSDGGHAHMDDLAACIPTIVAGVSGSLTGPDIYTLTAANPSWLDVDGLHFTETGYQNIETEIAEYIAGLF